MTLVDGQHIRSLFVIRILKYWKHSRQLVETVVHTQGHRLDADKFPMLSGCSWTWQGLYPDLDPCWFE